MDAGHEAHAHRPSDGLGDTALIDGPQSRGRRMFDPAHLSHILGHDGEVLQS